MAHDPRLRHRPRGSGASPPRPVASRAVLLRLDTLGRSFGGRTLFEGVSLDVRAGDRIGLVGPNGAGKTTLLRIAAGIDRADTARSPARHRIEACQRST